MRLLKTTVMMIGISFSTLVQATEIEFVPTINVKGPTLTAQYLKEEDIDTIETLVEASYSEGLPNDPKEWARNLVKRRKAGNYFCCLIFKDENFTPIAAIGFGRMPALNYDSKFTDIIDTFIEFGVTRPKNLKDGYVKENIERVENRGIGMLLPIIPGDMSLILKQEIVKTATDVFQAFKDKKLELPIEKTLPHDLIVLLHPNDPLGNIFENVGYERIEKEGFFGFYDKQRVILHKVL